MDMEKEFSTFIDGEEYDRLEAAIFTAVRQAFKAGWNAAQAAKETQQETPKAEL